MRVALLAETADRRIVRIAGGLARRGYRPAIITIRPVAAISDATKLPVHALNARNPWDPRIPVRLIRALRGVRPHVLMAFHLQGALLGRVAAALVRVPMMISSLNAAERGILRNLLLRATDRLSRLTVAPTARVAEALASRGAVARSRLRVIAPPVEPPPPDDAASAARARLRIADGEFVWVSVLEPAPASDYATLLDACARLDERCEHWRLVIASDGTLRRKMEQLRDRLALNERVLFAERQDDPGRVLPAADAVVTSSIGEGAPIPLIEAMLAGRPCVASAAGGTPDLVEHGVTGWLVPPRRPDRLADCMLEVMQLPVAQRAAVAEAGRASAASAFDVHRVIDEWEDLIADAARRRSRRAERTAHGVAAP